jgi:hypothetical protein
MENIKFPKLAKKQIEILVGFNYPGVHIALAADISGKNIREPSCRKTVFGNTAIYRAMEPPSTIMLTQVMKEARLERLCEQLLEFDEAGLAHVSSKPNSLMSPEDIRALQIVEAGICKKDTGHIQVPIPWAHDNPELPRNHDEVKRSDAKQEAKLKDKNPEAYCQLCGTIGEWLELDVARPLPLEVDPQDGFYIPKVLVIKNERDSTQCRICMDCSRSYGQPRRSLNDAVLIGPKLKRSPHWSADVVQFTLVLVFFIVLPRVPNGMILSFVTQFLVLRALRSDELNRRGNLRALNLPNGLHTGQLTLYNSLC